MKRPAAKRKAEEPLEEVEPEMQAVAAATDGPGEANEGPKVKKRATRTPEEREVLEMLPDLPHYRVLQLAISQIV